MLWTGLLTSQDRYQPCEVRRGRNVRRSSPRSCVPPRGGDRAASLGFDPKGRVAENPPFTSSVGRSNAGSLLCSLRMWTSAIDAQPRGSSA